MALWSESLIVPQNASSTVRSSVDAGSAAGEPARRACAKAVNVPSGKRAR